VELCFYLKKKTSKKLPKTQHSVVSAILSSADLHFLPFPLSGVKDYSSSLRSLPATPGPDGCNMKAPA